MRVQRTLPGRATALALSLAFCVTSSAPASAHGCHHKERHTHPFARLMEEAAVPGPGTPVDDLFDKHWIPTPELFSHVCVEGAIEPPPGWISADGHAHHESCDGILPPPERLYFDSSCLGEQFLAPRDVQLASSLVWATSVIGQTPFVAPGTNLVGGACLEVGSTEIVYRMHWEGYDGPAGPVPGVIDFVSGVAEAHPKGYLPYGVPVRDRIVQDGVEVSGWDASYFGHPAALNITSAGADLFANYEALDNSVGCAPLFDGDALAHPDLAQKFDYHEYLAHFECGIPGPPPVIAGHRNDGTGNWAGPLLEIFRRDESAVVGYMHQYWPIDTVVGDEDYGPGFGWNWFEALGADYAEREIRCFPQDLRAAFPDNFEAGNLNWPLFAAADIATGWVDFLEAHSMTKRDTNLNTQPTSYDCGGTLKAACGEEDHFRTSHDAWFGMAYKLMSAGVPVAISAGSDGTCDATCVPRTWVRVGDTAGLAPSEIYDRYTDSLASGHVSLATEGHHFLDLEIEGSPIGERVDIAHEGSVEVVVRYTLLPTTLDADSPDAFFDANSDFFTEEDRVLELVRGGEVVASYTLKPTDFVNGVFTAVLPNVDVPRSTWFAARTSSTSAHTGFIPVYVANEPIAHCLEAEYWMIYCDYVQSKIDAYESCQLQMDAGGNPVFVPEFLEQWVGCSQQQMEQRLREARSIFRSLRDVSVGDPWGVCRTGTKLASTCREPLSIVVGGEVSASAGPEVRVSALHAPPDAIGLLFVGNSAAGPAEPAALPPFFDPNLAIFPVLSNRGGHHEVATSAGLAGLGALHLQYVWAEPDPCESGVDFTWTEAVTLFPPDAPAQPFCD